MRPVAVVMVDEDAEHLLEVSAVDDQEPVETFRADGADEAFCDRIRLRRADRCFDDLDPFAAEDDGTGPDDSTDQNRPNRRVTALTHPTGGSAAS